MKLLMKNRRRVLQGLAGAALLGAAAGRTATAAEAAGATPFQGLRLRHDSALDFDEVLRRLYLQLGEKPVDVHRIGQENASAADFDRALQPFIGPTGFMLFSVFDHGSWTIKYGIARREVRLIFGNPLIAIGMLKYDLDTGLFVPLELLLTAAADGHGCSLLYLQPSSLMMAAGNPPLLAAARALDAKAHALAVAVTSA